MGQSDGLTFEKLGQVLDDWAGKRVRVTASGSGEWMLHAEGIATRDPDAPPAELILFTLDGNEDNFFLVQRSHFRGTTWMNDQKTLLFIRADDHTFSVALLDSPRSPA
jgi:hypothetical protein